MKKSVIVLYVVALNVLLMSAAEEKESIVVSQQLQEHIKEGNWKAWRDHRQQLLRINGQDLVDLRDCLEERGIALMVSVLLLDKDVQDHVQEMHRSVKELATDEGISACPTAKKDDTVAKDFIKKEREQQEQLWFWQKDYSRDRALKIFALLQNAHVAQHTQRIQQDIAQKYGNSAHEIVLNALHGELLKTQNAKNFVQSIKKQYWKKVYQKYQDAPFSCVVYEKRNLTDSDDQQELSWMPCTIL